MQLAPLTIFFTLVFGLLSLGFCLSWNVFFGIDGDDPRIIEVGRGRVRRVFSCLLHIFWIPNSIISDFAALKWRYIALQLQDITFLSKEPRIILHRNFLSPLECEHIISLGMSSEKELYIL